MTGHDLLVTESVILFDKHWPAWKYSTDMSLYLYMNIYGDVNLCDTGLDV